MVEVDTQEKFDALTEADAIVLRILKMPKEVVARIKGLKMIMRWGAGFDSVDIEEAGKYGIYVCNTPGANAYAVAELTVALMLAVGRKLICHDRKVHQGSTLTDSECKTLLHSYWMNQLDCHLYVITRHAHLCSCWKLANTCYVSCSEVELWTIVVEEWSMIAHLHPLLKRKPEL